MEYIQALLRKYPNRIKYGILVLDVFAMILAIRTYVNYVSIETAIESANLEQVVKTDELAFTQNFLVNYEKSDYAKYFLEHENNMLLDNEHIIKFEDMYQKQQANSGSTSTTPYVDYQDKTVNSPQESWKKFILNKISK
ncbi:MAG: hypothetical protein NTY80_01515 [candidate division SR1 bacterium]|nr:hypothetical protein [candidate division SR1 bacterium]